MRIRDVVVCSLIASFSLNGIARADEVSKPNSIVVLSTVKSPAPSPDEKDVGPAISPMKKKQIAPFTGVLLSPAAVAAVITDYKTAEQKTEIEVKKAVGLIEAKRAFDVSEIKASSEADKKIMKASLDEKTARIKILEDQVANVPSRTTWAGIGFVGGVIFSALTAFVVVQIVK